MSDSSTYLAEYQKALAAQGIDRTPLVSEAEALELLSGAHLKHALESFPASADRLPLYGIVIMVPCFLRRLVTSAQRQSAKLDSTRHPENLTIPFLLSVIVVTVVPIGIIIWYWHKRKWL
jgi:hypothetical protein